jgi:hypothetical protein
LRIAIGTGRMALSVVRFLLRLTDSPFKISKQAWR